MENKPAKKHYIKKGKEVKKKKWCKLAWGIKAKRCKTGPWCTLICLFWTNTPDTAIVRQKQTYSQFLNSGQPLSEKHS